MSLYVFLYLNRKLSKITDNVNVKEYYCKNNTKLISAA